MLEEGKGHPSKPSEMGTSSFSFLTWNETLRVFSWFIPWESGQVIAWSIVVLLGIPVTLPPRPPLHPLLKEKCVLFFSFKLYQRKFLPSSRAYFDLSLPWERTMDERSESNVLELRRAFTGPAHDKDDPHKDHFNYCHHSEHFSRSVLKELITLHFLLPFTPNLCIFCPLLITLIPGFSLGCPFLCEWGFTCFLGAGALFLFSQTM